MDAEQRRKGHLQISAQRPTTISFCRIGRGRKSHGGAQRFAQLHGHARPTHAVGALSLQPQPVGKLAARQGFKPHALARRLHRRTGRKRTRATSRQLLRFRLFSAHAAKLQPHGVRQISAVQPLFASQQSNYGHGSRARLHSAAALPHQPAQSAAKRGLLPSDAAGQAPSTVRGTFRQCGTLHLLPCG